MIRHVKGQSTGVWRLAATTTFAALLHVACAAQPRGGDFAVAFDVAGSSAVGFVDPTGRLTTITTGPFPGKIERIRMAADNRAILVLSSTNTSGALHRVTPGGAITTVFIHRTQGVWTDFLIDQDGAYILLRYTGALRVDGPSITPLPLSGQAITRDGDSIDLFHAAGIPNVYLYRAERARGTTRPVGGPGRPILHTSLEYDPTTGGFLWGGGGLFLIDRNYRMTTFYSQGSIVGMRPDPASDGIFVADPNRIYRLERNGRYSASWGSFTALRDFEVWGSRTLTTKGASKPGTRQTISIDLPDSPDAPYFAALSFSGRRPGIRVGPRTIAINPDPLFFSTFGGGLPGLTWGFAGRLDALGRARAGFEIRHDIAQSTIYTLAVAALNASKPGGVDTATISVGVF